jgi:hypothetical protein
MQRPPAHVERRNAALHMALSMWGTDDQARAVTEAFGFKLGVFVGEVERRGERGIWFAQTGAEGHFAVWGRPADLQACLVGVEAV